MNLILPPQVTESAIQLSLFEPPPLPVLAEPIKSESFQLREYQKKVIKDLYQLFRQGKRRPFTYAPTGSGKTAIASKILADAVSRGRRCLFLVHRDPLVEQTQKALAVYGIKVGVIKAKYKENRQLDVQIASIQSLAQREFPENIDVIIIDECHTNCWYKTFDRIKEYYPDSFYVGLTASPWRTKSSEYMGQHFDSIVKAPGVAELIGMKYLAPPRYFGFGGLLDLAAIDDGEDGDFNKSQMQRACMKAGFNERIVEEYLKLAGDRTAIVFCSGVEQSRLVTSLFNIAGVVCEHLEANTDHETRKAMYARLKSKETQVLSSVGTLTEGFDEPSVSCVILGRPTRSRALLFQMAGRGLRIFPGKQDCLLLDFGENFSRLGFLTDPQPIQLEPLKRKSEAPPMIKECPNCHEMISTFALICPYCGFEFVGTVVDDHDDEAEELDLEMGELFANDQKPKIQYLRSQIRRVYKQKLSIDRIWELFEAKWGHPAPNEWHKGAVFGKRGGKRGGDTEVNRQKYLDYLYTINPNPKNSFWIKFHMELEFGKQKTTSERARDRQHRNQQRQQYHQRQQQYQQRQQKYEKTQIDDDLPKLLKWWDVLGVGSTDTKADIKAAYRRLAKEYHPDCTNYSPEESKEKMQLINWAYEVAESFFT